MIKYDVGQRVVCVDDSIKPGKKWSSKCTPPKKGHVYTVKKIGNSFRPLMLCVWLEEIANISERHNGMDIGFRASRFKPVNENRLDVFRKMLNPTPTPELVE